MMTRLVLFALLAVAWCGSVLAQPYPSRPLRVVVPYPAGGYYDFVPRVVGPKLAEALGQPVVVENRVGGNGILGTEIAAKSRPDGYTIMVGGIGLHAINVSVHRNLPYDPVRDFAPIILVAVQPLVLVVNPKSEARSVKELIAIARAHPGMLAHGSNGTGGTSHLAGEMLSSMAGIKFNHVPYNGSPPAVMAVPATRICFSAPRATFCRRSRRESCAPSRSQAA